MSYLADPETFWLNITNIGLGLVTLFFLSVLVRTALRDIREHRRARQDNRMNHSV